MFGFENPLGAKEMLNGLLRPFLDWRWFGGAWRRFVFTAWLQEGVQSLLRAGELWEVLGAQRGRPGRRRALQAERGHHRAVVTPDHVTHHGAVLESSGHEAEVAQNIVEAGAVVGAAGTDHRIPTSEHLPAITTTKFLIYFVNNNFEGS